MLNKNGENRSAKYFEMMLDYLRDDMWGVWLKPHDRMRNEKNSTGLKIRSRRAFTLIELSIVIFIIGVLAAISYPNMTKIYYDYQLEGAATVLASDFRFALNKALSNKEIVNISGTNEVYMDVRYGIEFSNDVSYTIYSYYFDGVSLKWKILSQLDETQIFPTGVILKNFDTVKNGTTGKYSVIYNNNGNPMDENGNTLVKNTLKLYSSFTGTKKKIIIDLNTGKPRIE